MSFKRAVGFARDGLTVAWRSQANFRRQIILASSAVFLGWSVGLSASQWAILVVTIGLVLTAELLNTVIEEVVNLVTREQRLEAKIAKDVAAGMVLLTSAIAVVVGWLLFAAPLWEAVKLLL